jgi:cation diffusion facilitator family transporter
MIQKMEKKHQFPDPIPLPLDVYQARRERSENIIRSALVGIYLRSIIVCAEFIGVAFVYSSSLLIDGIASLIDVAFSIFLIICIKLAGRPPDEEHPFGHGRYEPLVGFQSGVFLVLVGLGMIVAQFYEMGHSMRETLDEPIWIIPLFAIVLLEIAYRIVIHTANKQHSPALAADAAHYRVDMLTSLFAMTALLIASFVPEWGAQADQIGAIAISIIMIILGIKASKGNFNQIVDRVPDQKFFQCVDKAAKSVEGVKGVEKTRIQLYGPDAQVDIDIEVLPTLSVAEGHKISQEVRAAIQKEWPVVKDVMVHIEPYYPGDH